MLPKEEVHAKVDASYADIINAATKWQPDLKPKTEKEAPYPARRIKMTGTYAKINQMFASRKWSIGIPIVPPTVEDVEAMLKGTSHDPSEVLWVVPPRQGILTVELVAVLGVMAGATPDMMPLLLATVNAMKDPASAWRGCTTTTAATEPLLIISGPIVKELKLNDGTGTAGSGNLVQNALGHFVNLVGDVVGGSTIPDKDLSTIGSSADLVATVICENFDKTPWEQSFAEAQGFTRNDSIVTLTTCYPPSSNVDRTSTTAEGFLNTLSIGVAANTTGVSSCLTKYQGNINSNANKCAFVVVLVTPQHAAFLSDNKMKKQDILDYMLKAAALPYKYYAPKTCIPPESFGPYDENTWIPRFTSTESIKLVVTGGAGTQSQIWTPFPHVLHPVSVRIER